jgi:hypothetical protein
VTPVGTIREKDDELMKEVVDEIKTDNNGKIIAGNELMEIRV